MNYFNNLNIKEKFLTTKDYDNFIFWLNELFKESVDKYDYFGVKKEDWVKIFENIVNYEFNIKVKRSFKTRICEKLKKTVFVYIYNDIKNGNVRVINNLLIKFYYEYKKSLDTLKHSFDELYSLGITKKMIFNEKYYTLLKEKSSMFNKLLNNLGILDFNNEEFIDFINGKFDMYLNIRPYNKTLKWTIDTFNVVIPFINDKEYVLVKIRSKKGEDYLKIVFILDKYDVILEIIDLFYSLVGNANLNEIYKLIFNYDLERLEKLIKDYQSYKMSKDELTKDITFILEIATKLKTFQNLSTDEEIVTPYLENENILVIEKQIDLNIEKERNKRKYSSIYEFFPDGNLDFERKKIIVDELFNKLSTEEQKKVVDYINDRIKSNSKKVKVKSIIIRLKRHYQRYLETGCYPKRKKHSNIYEFFSNRDMDFEKKKEIVDMLFNNLSNEEQILINDYIRGNLKSKSEQVSIAKSKIAKLKTWYKKYFENVNDINHENINEYDLLLNKILNTLQIDRDINTLNVSLEKIKILLLSLNILECKYRENGYSKEMYDLFMSAKIKEILENNHSLDLESLIVRYINLAYSFPKFEEDVLHL